MVVQATELMQACKIIPDLATWLQCYSLYVATLASKFPATVLELMAYQTIIAKASQRYRRLSWVIYDYNFRQEAAGNPEQSWARVDPSIYTQCFTDQAISAENWCTRCQCIDHTMSSCPYRPRNSGAARAEPVLWLVPGKQDQVCIKYNNFNRDCKFGKECRFLHVCSSCRQPHPVSCCKASGENNN